MEKSWQSIFLMHTSTEAPTLVRQNHVFKIVWSTSNLSFCWKVKDIQFSSTLIHSKLMTSPSPLHLEPLPSPPSPNKKCTSQKKVGQERFKMTLQLQHFVASLSWFQVNTTYLTGRRDNPVEKTLHWCWYWKFSPLPDFLLLPLPSLPPESHSSPVNINIIIHLLISCHHRLRTSTSLSICQHHVIITCWEKSQHHYPSANIMSQSPVNMSTLSICQYHVIIICEHDVNTIIHLQTSCHHHHLWWQHHVSQANIK